MRWLSILPWLLACNPEEEEVESFDLGAAVEQDALMGHLDALQAIGDANGTTRVSGSAGYQASVDYIVSKLEEAGYDVTLDPYEIGSFHVDAAQLAVGAVTFTRNDEGDQGYGVFPMSGAGDVTAEAVAVDVTVPPGGEGSSDSGCETGDFDGFPSGAIALIQRGSCTFSAKVANAVTAGASAVLIFNEGQPGRTEPFVGALGEEQVAVPVIALSYAAGESIVESGTAVTVHVLVDASADAQVEYNVIAELPGQDPDHIAMVGAHLDSVAAGPGINDNGSGTALVLETALQAAAADWEPVNTVRFAWWGAEEEGLVGSYHWATDEETGEFDAERLDPLVAYLNYDMLASGNGYRFVYDGSSEGGGSDFIAIQEIYEAWLDERGLAYTHTPLLISTDSYWFVQAGVPTGGLYSGSSEPMASGWADAFDGEVGEELDACYHQACDIVANTNPDLYGELGAAAAHAVQVVADTAGGDLRRRPPLDLPRPTGSHDHVRWDR